MTFEERIEALTSRHEALTMNVQLMQAMQAEMQTWQGAMQTTQADIHVRHEYVQKELEMVLRSQVLMSDSLDKLTGRMKELTEAQLHTDKRMDALILTVDEIITRPERRAEGSRGLKKWHSIPEN